MAVWYNKDTKQPQHSSNSNSNNNATEKTEKEEALGELEEYDGLH
jgi:hypothetical protein